MSYNQAVMVDPDAPGKLVLRNVDAPTAAPTEAVVQVAAISLNRGEIRMSQNAPAGRRPGWDFAGTVTQAAHDGSGPKEGARVVGMLRSGAWANYVAAPTNQIAALPDAVTFEQASTLPVAGLTALHALWKGGFLLERPVLITGATGGVGDYAIQLAKLAGAIVVAHVRRPEQEAFVRTAGADFVVIGESVAEAKQYGPYALILDSVGGQVLSDVLGLVEEGTKVVIFGTSAGNQVTFDAQKFYGVGMTTLYGLILFDELRTVESADKGLARLAKLVGEDRLKPQISVEANWTQIADIARQLLDRSYPGKAVLHVK
jgi:NADPH2:quinone reductase